MKLKIKTTKRNSKKIEFIKDLYDFSKENKKLFLNTFNKINLKKFIFLEKELKMNTYMAMLNGHPIYIKYCGQGLIVSRGTNVFNVTNDSFFSFLKKNNLKPIDFTLFIKN